MTDPMLNATSASQPAPPAPSPFGARAGRSRRIVTWGLVVGVPLAALAVVYFARRPRPATTTRAHDHGAMQTADSTRPVALSDDAARRIGVTFTTVATGPIEREVRTVGQVTFDETRVKTVSPRIDGWVERLYVDFTGKSLRAGDPLLSIYSPMLVMAQEELLLATRLARDVSGGTADAARGAEDLVRSARRRLSYWDIPEAEIAAIERSGEVRRALTLRSPVGGVVVEKNVLAGQRVMAGDALYRVVDLSVVWVEGEVFEQDLSVVRLGLPIVAEFEALPGEPRNGRITYLYPTLDPDTRTARVRVELPNPGLRLMPGMYATFRFTARGRPDVLTIPRSAVLSTGERSLVFVRRADGRLEPRDVQLGGVGEDRIEVLSGLAAGETIVASATFLVDAESNLGSALGGMGDMPGMDITKPKGERR